MDKYIIVGEYKDNGGTIYISNTNPICWVQEERLSKKYDSLIDAIHDIVNEYRIYRTTILCTDINYISILSLENRSITPVVNSEGELIDSDEF